MAETMIALLLDNLIAVVKEDLTLYLGVGRDITKLCSMFTAIKATLQDAAEKQFSDEAIKDWLQKLKHAVHELDDILDEVRSTRLPSYSFHPKRVVFGFKIANKIKSIRERLDEIAEERQKFHLSETAPEKSGANGWRQTSSFITEPQVYGREKDTKKIVDFLIRDADGSHHEDLSVYPIVGLGGLGKTTLAKLIFNHEKVVNHFERRIWVCISEDFGLKRVTKAIIEAASGHACEDLDLEPLQRRMQDLLQSRRYLLVLDDVWDDKQPTWQRLKSVLACGAKGASILVTTRLPTVAAVMGTMPPHELSMLSDNDCWELFKYQAFGHNEVEQVELVDIGKEIVKKCGGVPLAAIALGGLLRFKRERKEWVYVKESNLWNLPHDENSIMPALRLSYLNLPIKLRQCFAYCAIFPKDEKIRKQYLIELWMANGFISSNEILDAEEVGDGVWRELYWRSLFHDIKTDKSGKVISFKLHDLVHDLAQSVAEDVCCIATEDNVVATLSERIHHLSNCSEETINLSQLHRLKSLRTYIGRYSSNQLCPHVLKCYSLRVLHCEGRRQLSSSIGDLKHLRYLNLSWGRFETLPESLCKLWNLQMLKLDGCRELQKLPNSLTRLMALQQLSLKACDKLSSLPPHIRKLTSLRILTTFFVGKEKGFHLAELGALKLKGDLQIIHLERVKSVMDAQKANMSSKQLNELGLKWERNDEESELEEKVEDIVEVLQPDTQQLESLMVKGYKGANFPRWMFSSSLKQLVIKDCEEVEGLHEALRHMTALKRLELNDLPKLEFLPDCFGNLSLLRQLTIGFCDKLRCLPTSLSHSNLNSLRIYGCHPDLEKRCEKEIGEDWPKIAHIPRITVGGEGYDSD